MSEQPIPLTVLTGFLGAGKTTLLNHLLQQPGMERTAVLINEFGEVGLDHLLVGELGDDTVLLSSGCICCSVREDLVAALKSLLEQRAEGIIPVFDRVLVETTGLADPAPILHTLMTDGLLMQHFRLDGIVTCVDAFHGIGQLDEHPEALKQAAVADRLVLTKTDLGDDAATATLMHRLRQLNPAATLLKSHLGVVDPTLLLDCGLFNPETKTADVRRWLSEESFDEHTHDHDHAHHDVKRHDANRHDTNRHDDRIRAFCLSIDTPIHWEGFVTWMEMLTATRGESLLRVKGILNVIGSRGPVAIHGVQHVFHPPAALPDWPDDDRASKIVFITRDLSRQAVEDTFRAFIQSAEIAANGRR